MHYLRVAISLALTLPLVQQAAAAPPADARRADPRTSISAVDLRATDHPSPRWRELREPAQPKGGGAYTLTQLTFTTGQTGTDFPEPVVIMTPFGYDPLGPEVPLILVFNGYANSALKFFSSTPTPQSDIDEEANARGWLMLAVTCLDTKSYGWITGQIHVDVALDYVLANYRVDPDRIYAIGWSMGGGSVASYAARHLDPARPMIAAIGTNAGTYDLVDVYNNEIAEVQDLFEHPNLFQGPPSGSYLFNYRRTQTETTSGSPATVFGPLSQARNLRHVPVRHVYSTDDEIPYLPAQNQRFAAFLAAEGATISSTPFSDLPDTHSWFLFDADQLLDWLAQRTVERSPASFAVVADRDATYYWIDVQQRSATALSDVTAAFAAAENRVALSDLANVAVLALDPPAPFDSSADFGLALETADAGTTNVIVSGVTAAPDYVVDGSEVFETWAYDGPSDTLTFTFTGPGSFDLAVHFDEYHAVLSGPANISIGGNLHFDIAESTPGQPYLLLIGPSSAALPIGLFDPGDDRSLLVGFSPAPAMFVSSLGGGATAALDFPVTSAVLAGSTVYAQFLTFPGGATIVDQISPRLEIAVN